MRREKSKALPLCLTRIIVFFSLLLSLFSFVSCQDPLSPLKDEITLPANSGSFSLTVAGTSARTIIPETPVFNDFAVYELAFTAAGAGTDLTVDRTNTTLANPVVLVAGTYDLTVRAYKETAKTTLLAKSEATSLVITAGQNTAQTVTLKPLSAGTVDGNPVNGNFSWDITFDTAAVTIETATMTIKDSGGNTQAAVDLTLTGNSSQLLSPGIYTVVFEIEGKEASGVSRSILWNELMYVYGNLTGSFIKTFTDDDFHRTHWNVYFEYDNGGPFETPAPTTGTAGTQSVAHGGLFSVPTFARPGYRFDGWFTEPACINEWDLAAGKVHNDMTLYAKWTANTAGITLSVEEIANGTADEDFSDPITIVRAAGHADEECEITVTGDYASVEWKIAKEGTYTDETTGTGDTFILSGTNPNYNTLGGHVLELTVTVGTGAAAKKYVLNILFTVVDPVVEILEEQLNALPIGTAASPSTVKLASSVVTTTATVPSGMIGCGLTGTFTIPAGVTEIGEQTFYGCSGLTGVQLPGNLTSIGNAAFRGASFTSVIIPAGVTEIGNTAFSGCTKLTSVTFERDGIIIGASAFPFSSALPTGGTDTLKTLYQAAGTGGAGTYVRTAGQDNWVKQLLSLVLIPAGTFQMGQTGMSDTTPHTVTLTKAFYMGKYEVTQAQYQAVMGTNPSSFTTGADAGEVQENRPVEQVSWYAADYNMTDLTDPLGASSGTNRILRGGDWNNVAAYLRSAYRYCYTPAYRYNGLGFRVVRTQG